MNQQSEEEKIRQLFHELREEDDRHTPSFASILEAALSKTESDKPRRFAWQLALVTASIILIVSLALLILRQSSPQQSINPAPTDDLILRLPDRKIEPSPAPLIMKSVEPRKIIRRKSLPARFHQPSMLISRWQSPTDFLLNTWGAELLKSVPRVTDSAVNLKPISTVEKN